MPYFIDKLLNNKDLLGKAWYIAEPYIDPLITRIKDAIGILTGKYRAVVFARTLWGIEKKAVKKNPDYKRQVFLVDQDLVNKVIKEVNKAAIQDEYGIKIDENDLTTNVGRNDPCPCKSGLKFKKCCGKDE